MAKFNRLLSYLNQHNVRYRVLSHAAAFTAHQMALASDVPDRNVAKTLLVKADQQYWMVVLGADKRLDERLLKKALEVHHVHMAQENELEEFFSDCEPSTMPPFGKLYGLPVILEKGLTEDEEILFHACTHSNTIMMRYEDFERLADPIIAQFAETEEQDETSVADNRRA